MSEKSKKADTSRKRARTKINKLKLNQESIQELTEQEAKHVKGGVVKQLTITSCQSTDALCSTFGTSECSGGEVQSVSTCYVYKPTKSPDCTPTKVPYCVDTATNC